MRSGSKNGIPVQQQANVPFVIMLVDLLKQVDSTLSLN